MGIQTIFGLHFGKLLKTPRFKKVFFFFARADTVNSKMFQFQ